MRYPILIEEGSDITAFGVVVPDFPGCFSAGDTLDAALDSDTRVPAPSTLDQVRRLADDKGWAVGVIDLEGDLFDDTIERLNITLPTRVRRRLDDLARLSGNTRGGVISKLTLQAGRLQEKTNR